MAEPLTEFEKRVVVGSKRFNEKDESPEWLTATYLVDNLKMRLVGDYRILMNHKLPDRGRGFVGSLEIDAIIINHFGVFAIEVRDWSGKVVAYDGNWVQNSNREHGDIFGEINYKTKTLKGNLFGAQGDLKDMGNVSVVGLIVLYKGLQFFENQSKRFKNSKNVFGLTPELINALSSTNFLQNPYKSQTLTDIDIIRVADALYKTHGESREINIAGDVAERLAGDTTTDAPPPDVKKKKPKGK